MKRILGIFIIVVFFVPAVFTGEPGSGKVPDFSLTTLKGETFHLKDSLEKGPVLINFWATWCGPCLREMKKIKPIYNRYKAKGFQVVSISIDDEKTSSQVRGIVRSRRIPYIILLDTDQKVKRLFQVQNPPFSILINTKGEVVYQHEGYRDGDEKELEEALSGLLEQKK